MLSYIMKKNLSSFDFITFGMVGADSHQGQDFFFFFRLKPLSVLFNAVQKCNKNVNVWGCKNERNKDNLKLSFRKFSKYIKSLKFSMLFYYRKCGCKMWIISGNSVRGFINIECLWISVNIKISKYIVDTFFCIAWNRSTFISVLEVYKCKS